MEFLNRSTWVRGIDLSVKLLTTMVQIALGGSRQAGKLRRFLVRRTTRGVIRVAKMEHTNPLLTNRDAQVTHSMPEAAAHATRRGVDPIEMLQPDSYQP